MAMKLIFDENDKWYIHTGLNLKHYIVIIWWKKFNNQKFLRFKQLVNYHGIAGFGAYATVNDEYQKAKIK